MTTPSAACRSETQTAARRFNPSGTLRVVLRLRTASSAVWICVFDVSQDRLLITHRDGRKEVQPVR